MAIAPWARLTTPDPRWTRITPMAIAAYTAPAATPSSGNSAQNGTICQSDRAASPR